MIGWNLTFLHLHFGQVFCKSLHSAFLGAGFGAGRRCFFKLARNSSISVFYEIKHTFNCWMSNFLKSFLKSFYLLTEEELEAINLLVSCKEYIHKCISSVPTDIFLIFQETYNLGLLLGHTLDLKAKLLFLHSEKWFEKFVKKSSHFMHIKYSTNKNWLSDLPITWR